MATAFKAHGRTLRCPYLSKDVVYSCGSGPGAGIIDAPRLRNSCKCENHRSCPLYVAGSGYVGFYYELEPAA